MSQTNGLQLISSVLPTELCNVIYSLLQETDSARQLNRPMTHERLNNCKSFVHSNLDSIGELPVDRWLQICDSVISPPLYLSNQKQK